MPNDTLPECPQEVIHLAQRAERRLNQKYRKLLGKGKPQGKIICAVARELAGSERAMAHRFPASSASSFMTKEEKRIFTVRKTREA